MSKYFGNKSFYKMILIVAVPIMIQNFITNFVNVLDNLMVGSVGTEEMSGVSIVNQLIFVFNLAIFGALSGAGIFTSQFYGKRDEDGIRYTLRYKSIVSIVLAVVAVGSLALFGDKLISLYLHDGNQKGNLEETMLFAKQYLKVILYGLIPYAVTQMFSSTLRETGETLVPMLVGFGAVSINCIFNYLLIFGKFGFPLWGVKGAAVATVISRYVECMAIILYIFIKRKRFSYVKNVWKSLYIPKALFYAITFKGMPLLCNEFIWASGISLLSMSYSLYSIDVVAGYSISSTVLNLFNIAFLSLGSSIGIVVGKLLGAGQFKEAIDTDRKMIVFSVLISVVLCGGVFLSGDYIPLLYKTSELSKEYASYFIKVSACLMPFSAMANASYFTLRSGGKTIVTFLFDSVFMMTVSVPISFACYHFFGFTIFVTYFISQSLEGIKAVIGGLLVSKHVWVNNIVE